MQVLLVAGGAKYSSGYIYLDSTEVLEDMAGTWRLTAPLPSARHGLRAASVENNIFVFGENILYYINIEHLILSLHVDNGDIFTGGYDGDGDNYLKDILRYNKNQTWENVGQMQAARGYQAVAVLEDVSQLCP